jgi:hypothetical protein
VTCVEAGRWHEASDADIMLDTESGGTPAAAAPAPDTATAEAPAMADAPAMAAAPRARRAFASDELAYSKLRKSHARYVTASLASGGGHRSDQGAVWGEVAMRMASTTAFSPSGAMHALYKTPERARKLHETVAALKRPEGTLGFVAVLGSEVLGAEVFADEALADAYWDKLARSYAVEALDAEARADASAPGASTPGESGAEPPTQAGDAAGGEARLLQEALAADIAIHPSPGLGSDARLTGQHVSGAGLVYDGAVVHLSLFPEETGEESGTEETEGEGAGRGAVLQHARPRGYGGRRLARVN